MISYTSFAFFILYFGITYVLYTLFPPKAKWCVLLAGSWIYYFISSKGHIEALTASTVTVWGAALLLQRLDNSFSAKKQGLSRENRKSLKKRYAAYKKGVFAAGIVISAGFLIVLKYSDFFIGNINSAFALSLNGTDFVQPLGISFFTLQAISYLTDVYRGRYEARKNILRVSLYLSFMLTIVEGPVTRYDKTGFQLENCKSFNAHAFELGAQRIIWGLFKKIVVADRAAEFVNSVFGKSDEYTGIAVVFAILFYTLQLYLEFSGVMDVVCGMGEMMGITLEENFERPFFSKSINEFWQRWHITLGAFLRDYIFYSVTFSKPFMKSVKNAREKFNPYFANLIPTSAALFLVWLTNGFWHGSGWKYIVYGLYYYVLMMLAAFCEPFFAKLCTRFKIDRKSKSFSVFQTVRTFVIVNIGMLIFRADTLKQAVKMLVSIFKSPNFSVLMPGNGGNFGLDLFDYAIIVSGAGIVFAVSLMREKGIDIRKRITEKPLFLRFIGYIAAALTVVMIGAYGEGYGVVDLIYANF